MLPQLFLNHALSVTPLLSNSKNVCNIAWQVEGEEKRVHTYSGQNCGVPQDIYFSLSFVYRQVMCMARNTKTSLTFFLSVFFRFWPNYCLLLFFYSFLLLYSDVDDDQYYIFIDTFYENFGYTFGRLSFLFLYCYFTIIIKIIILCLYLNMTVFVLQFNLINANCFIDSTGALLFIIFYIFFSLESLTRKLLLSFLFFQILILNESFNLITHFL